MLLSARLTTDVTICANNTPSEVAIRTRRGRVRSAVRSNHVGTRVMAPFLAFDQRARSRLCASPHTPEIPTRFPRMGPELASVDRNNETNVFNWMDDKY